MCAEGKSLQPLAFGCKIVRTPPDDGNQHGRRLVRAAIPWLHNSMHLCYIHHDCIHNQIVSVHNRVCGVVPSPSEVGLTRLRRAFRRLSNLLPPTTADDYYVMPALYSGAKRLKYEEATADVLSMPITKRDAGIKMFVKGEKLKPDPCKPNPDPRAIQFRDPRYCVEISRYLKPIEHHLYNLAGYGRGVSPSRVIAKGLNQVERAELLLFKWRQFDDPVAVLLDASRFDKHVSAELLKLEHGVYLRSNRDPHFQKLLSWQLRNKCRTSKGLRYVTRGKRMSGDMNTALGNCIIMTGCVGAALEDCPKWDLVDDGDDVVVIIERAHLEKFLSSVKEDFLSFGFDVKVEGVVDNIHDIEFCQSKVIEYEPGKYKFVRDPWKVLSTALAGARHWSQKTARGRLAQAIGLCELVLNLQVPVLQAFAEAILRNVGSDNPLFMGDDSSIVIRVRRELRTMGVRSLHAVKARTVTPEGRASFERAFGVSAADQVAMEQKLASWKFGLEELYVAPVEWNVADWLQLPSDLPEVHLL